MTDLAEHIIEDVRETHRLTTTYRAQAEALIERGWTPPPPPPLTEEPTDLAARVVDADDRLWSRNPVNNLWSSTAMGGKAASWHGLIDLYGPLRLWDEQ